MTAIVAKVDLDALERKAGAAPGPWRVSNSDPTKYSAVLYDDNTGDSYEVCDECTPENAAHIAANSPDVTRALIARIRELDEALSDALAYTLPGEERDRLVRVLARGAVLQ